MSLSLFKVGPTERPGRVSIHHVAVHARTKGELSKFNEMIKEDGMMTNSVVDCHYFELSISEMRIIFYLILQQMT